MHSHIPANGVGAARPAHADSEAERLATDQAHNERKAERACERAAEHAMQLQMQHFMNTRNPLEGWDD